MGERPQLAVGQREYFIQGLILRLIRDLPRNTFTLDIPARHIPTPALPQNPKQFGQLSHGSILKRQRALRQEDATEKLLFASGRVAALAAMASLSILSRRPALSHDPQRAGPEVRTRSRSGSRGESAAGAAGAAGAQCRLVASEISNAPQRKGSAYWARARRIAPASDARGVSRSRVMRR